MEFYRSLCRFCSKSMWRIICVEKICVEKKWQIWGLETPFDFSTTINDYNDINDYNYYNDYSGRTWRLQDCKFFEDQSLQSLKCVGGKYGFAAVLRINKKIDVWRMEEGLRYSKFQSFSANISTRVLISHIVVKSHMKQVVINTWLMLVWFNPDISNINYHHLQYTACNDPCISIFKIFFFLLELLFRLAVILSK